MSWWFPAAARIASAYAAFSIAWILVGDRLAANASPGESQRLTIEDAKGLLFVALSGLLIYVLVARHEAHRLRSLRDSRTSTTRR